jgi:hypothetical protein
MDKAIKNRPTKPHHYPQLARSRGKRHGSASFWPIRSPNRARRRPTANWALSRTISAPNGMTRTESSSVGRAGGGQADHRSSLPQGFAKETCQKCCLLHGWRKMALSPRQQKAFVMFKNTFQATGDVLLDRNQIGKSWHSGRHCQKDQISVI